MKCILAGLGTGLLLSLATNAALGVLLLRSRVPEPAAEVRQEAEASVAAAPRVPDTPLPPPTVLEPASGFIPLVIEPWATGPSPRFEVEVPTPLIVAEPEPDERARLRARATG